MILQLGKNKPFIKCVVFAALSIVMVAIAASSTAAQATASASITTAVDSLPAPPDEDGTCSVCWADATSNSSGSEATLTMYFQDNGQDFDGMLNLALELTGGGTASVTISDVSMSDRSKEQFVIRAGTHWDWLDVTRVTVVAVPR